MTPQIFHSRIRASPSKDFPQRSITPTTRQQHHYQHTELQNPPTPNNPLPTSNMAERIQRLLSNYPFTTTALGTGTILIAPVLVALGGHTAAGMLTLVSSTTKLIIPGVFAAAAANSGHGFSFMSVLKGVGWVLGGIAQQLGELVFGMFMDGLFGTGPVGRIKKSGLEERDVRIQTRDTEREKDEGEKEVEVEAGKEKLDGICL
ncbi:hypothetical protein VFPPC_02687 [Pochonia chlamydosporia 170]|uniref:Uncharacterized protein n=1 Tax=Pochonia chlamydosporia 170 TaxID=1380566 RepID=A0A179FWX2_METCM|nr:hypothetical protein VFPPC_02687 [Pochonia chlamydosporia 170]OAQ70176.2 hypothetical protein VFPPC_02687 [Pochonia chlamydosporia 170]